MIPRNLINCITDISNVSFHPFTTEPYCPTDEYHPLPNFQSTSRGPSDTCCLTPFLPLSLQRSTCPKLQDAMLGPSFYVPPSNVIHLYIFNFHLFVNDSQAFIFHLKMSIHKSHLNCPIKGIRTSDNSFGRKFFKM